MNPIDELNLKLGIGPKRPVIPQGLMAKGYKSIKQVGKGAFGSAILVFHQERGQYSIAKEVVLMGMNDKQKREAYNEILILSQLHHPNIIAYEEQYEKQDKLLIVMEYADGGDLLAKITSKKSMGMRFRQHEVVRIFCQTALAIKYLHDRMVLHRDLKSQNIFLTKSGVVKLGDFGISTVLQNSVMFAKTICGTPFYFSPELCKGNAYNNKSDIWALGCVLFEVLTLDVPFRGRNMNDLMNKIVSGQYSTHIDPIYDVRWAAVLRSMLETNHDRRASIDDVCRNEFLRELFGTLEREFERQREELAHEKATGQRAGAESFPREDGDADALHVRGPMPPRGGASPSADPSPRDHPPTHGRRSVANSAGTNGAEPARKPSLSPPPHIPAPKPTTSPQQAKLAQPKTRVEIPVLPSPLDAAPRPPCDAGDAQPRPSYGRRSNPTSPKAGAAPKFPTVAEQRKASMPRPTPPPAGKSADELRTDSLRELDEAFKGLDAAIGPGPRPRPGQTAADRIRPKHANPTAVIEATPSPPQVGLHPMGKGTTPQPVRPPQNSVMAIAGVDMRVDGTDDPGSPMPQQRRDLAKLQREAENLAIFIRTVTEQQAAAEKAEEKKKDFGDEWASGLDLTMATGPEESADLPDSGDFNEVQSFCIGEQQFSLTASPARVREDSSERSGGSATTSADVRLAAAQAQVEALRHELAEERGRAGRLQSALDDQRPTLQRMQAQLDEVRNRNIRLTEENLLLKRENRELKAK